MSAVRVDGRDMAGLVDKLLADKNSGLKTDDTGRRYFRQRHVQFHTIEIQAKDLHGPGWLDFETDLALDWNKDPSHEEIRSFAVKSSHRFLSFWYRVFDVAAARSLSGRDRTVFRRAFFKASAFADLGVPDESAFSSVPPLLHRKILDEYKASKPFRSAYRIYYLSDYLEGLTDDMNAVLRPYRRLWRLQDARARILRQLDAIHAEVESALVGNPGARSDDDAASAETVSPLRQAEDFLELCGLSALDRSLENKTYVKIEDETARMLVFRRRTGALDSLEKDDIERIFHEPVFSVPGAAQTLLALMSLPARCHTSARRAASFSTQAHRLRLRLVRYQRLHGTKEGGSEALALRLRDAESRLAKIMEELKRPMGLAPLQSLADRYLMVLRMLRGIDQRIEELYTLPSNRTDPSDIPPTGTAGREAPTEHRDSRFMEAGTVVLPVDVIPGDPFAEPLVVSLAKQVVLKRLRPVRMTANYYSLNPAHRHGCMTLNPVMKLWKERPHTGTRDLPRLCGLEMNTKETIECLVRLASIADPVLKERRVLRGRIAALQYGTETLETLKMFLVPGSCAAVREISRYDFPEFRGRVIGESRSPSELGIPVNEDAVLTGGWYRKNNHTLYYPVGGDNGRLLHLIWISGRSPGPPAFFFALGQFVHDCLEDKLTYTRSHGETFRECVEDYYAVEDRIRKNRDERTGRRRLDNTRQGIRFMFAVIYSRIVMEALTGSAQVQFRHAPTETWMHRNLGLPILAKTDRQLFRAIRADARAIVNGYE